MKVPKAWMSWSTGKDSAWALHVIRKQQQVEIVALLTTVNASAARVAMHAVRQSLLDAQAATLGTFVHVEIFSDQAFITGDGWQQIDAGATTFWEMYHPNEERLTRSHCHGWSAAPVA